MKVENGADEPEIENLVVPTDTLSDHKLKDEGIYAQHDENVHAFTAEECDELRTDILEWYDTHRRKLPWRGDPPPYVSTANHTSLASSRKGGGMDAFIKTSPSKASDASKTSGIVQSEPRKVSPYETWVSEIMLQQTRVDTVVEYFLKWIDRFPNVQALAEGSEEEVNSLWAGLGYYRRARMLHAGAKYVQENMNGELPSRPEELKKIPGIGPYTAGAIASIAFGERVPLVDGNVIRVLARLRTVGADPKNKRLVDYSWSTAEGIAKDCSRPGSLNQALMELGATVCTTQNPQCQQCPVKSVCLAYQTTQEPKAWENHERKLHEQKDCLICDETRKEEWANAIKDVTKYPLKAQKTKQRDEALAVAVISCPADAEQEPPKKQNWKYLMVRRPEGGLLSGQWEFVHIKMADSEKIPSYAERKKGIDKHLKSLIDTSDEKACSIVESAERRDLGDLTHIFSHIKHHMGMEHLHFDAMPVIKKKTSVETCWMDRQEMQERGITTGVKKILKVATDAKPTTIKKKAAASTASKRKQDETTSKPTKKTRKLTDFFTP